MKTAENIVISFSPYGSPIILGLPTTSSRNFDGVTTPCWYKNWGGWGIKFRDFLPITRYISQAIQEDSAILTMEGE